MTHAIVGTKFLVGDGSPTPEEVLAGSKISNPGGDLTLVLARPEIVELRGGALILDRAAAVVEMRGMPDSLGIAYRDVSGVYHGPSGPNNITLY